MAERIQVTSYSALSEGIGQLFKVDGDEIVLFRLTNGEVRAVENRSPHPKGGTLVDGLVSGEYVFCPVYDLKISLINGKVQAPDKWQVKVYPVGISDDKVYINI